MTLTATHAAPAASDKVKAVSPPEVSFPLSSGQQRLWFLELLRRGSPLYNIPVAVRLEGPLDATVLEQAVNQILCRHDVLRTRFDVQHGEPVQIVAPAPDVKFAGRRFAVATARQPRDRSPATLGRGSATAV